LDDIAEIPESIQVKLLRVLQEMEVSPVGSNKKINLDFRLISATHKDLVEEVSSGNFRKDFYYRIKGVNITIPPLRERGRDIVVLANYFLNEFAKENQLQPKTFSKGAIKKLMQHSFPGNVRELKSLVQTAFVLSSSEEIKSEDIEIETTDQLIDYEVNNEMTLDQHVTKIIQLKLNAYKNIIKTAKALDIGKSTIYKLIAEGKVEKGSISKVGERFNDL